MKRLWIALSVAFAAPALAADDAAQLKADILAASSATAVLGQWCAARHLADPPAITAKRGGIEVPASPQTRALLQAGADEPVRYRRVNLMCGSHVLSRADNWYVPARLTPAMNSALDTTDTPFGLAVKALGFHRKTLDAAAAADGQTILQVRALLLTADERPFSLVVENYSGALTAP